MAIVEMLLLCYTYSIIRKRGKKSMFLQHLPDNLIQSFFDLAYTLIATDGIIHKEEKEKLASCAEELHLSETPSCKIVDYDEALVAFDGLDDSVKKELFFELLLLVYADASYSVREKTLLTTVVNRFGISKDDAISLEAIARIPKKDENKLKAILYPVQDQ